MVDAPKVLRKTYRDGEVVATSKLRDLADVAEGSAHDDGVVSKLLVVIVNALDALDTRVFLRAVVLLGGGLVPVEDTTNKRGNEEGAGLSCSNCLDKGEHESGCSSRRAETAESELP